MNTFEKMERERRSWILLMDRAAEYLKNADFFIISVSKMCVDLSDSETDSSVEMEAMADHLKEDDRFRVIPGSDVNVDFDDFPYLSRDDVAKMGFNQGPRVMLKTRVPTRKEVIMFLLKKADQTFETLKKAWDLRPPDDETIEDRLLTALAKAQKLQRELSEILDGKSNMDLESLSLNSFESEIE